MSEQANLKSLIEAIPPPSKELLPLFAATVHLPGQARWTVHARAADEADVRAMLERRGHAVLDVRRVDRVEPTPATPRTQCLVCGYDLNLLPAHTRGEVTCPECGVINPAIGNNTGPLAQTRPRSARGIILTVGIMVGLLISLCNGESAGNPVNNVPHTPHPQSISHVPPIANPPGRAGGDKCGRCAYDLAGLSATDGQVKCPECGTDAQIPPEGVPFSVVCIAEDGSLFRRTIVATSQEAAARLAREQGNALAASSLRAPPMCCRRCHYVLSGLEVSGPDCLVKCPECGTLSTVPRQLLNEAYVDPEPGIILRAHSPGAALSVVGVVFALLGIWYVYLTFAAIALGAIACDRSAGKRGWFAMGLGASVFLTVLVLRSIAASSSP